MRVCASPHPLQQMLLKFAHLKCIWNNVFFMTVHRLFTFNAFSILLLHFCLVARSPALRHSSNQPCFRLPSSSCTRLLFDGSGRLLKGFLTFLWSAFLFDSATFSFDSLIRLLWVDRRREKEDISPSAGPKWGRQFVLWRFQEVKEKDVKKKYVLRIWVGWCGNSLSDFGIRRVHFQHEVKPTQGNSEH